MEIRRRSVEPAFFYRAIRVDRLFPHDARASPVNIRLKKKYQRIFFFSDTFDSKKNLRGIFFFSDTLDSKKISEEFFFQRHTRLKKKYQRNFFFQRHTRLKKKYQRKKISDPPSRLPRGKNVSSRIPLTKPYISIILRQHPARASSKVPFILVLMQEKVGLQCRRSRLRRNSARLSWAASMTSRLARSSTEAYSSARPF